ncbi:hypothetical protein GA0074695_2960 [Micromonospora viridifaciens]|uniref:Uncharacterized protein n=1 Tax=Micromonospora viridifaciens TaxID=1881 RepID=A0A1C4X2T7_MICVI|nr:hypothetical protein [Micromonospora viridifaciens]SCF02775.1 hypothetical protein GA0074695_2960 [Micromonospora viridifaciens]
MTSNSDGAGRPEPDLFRTDPPLDDAVTRQYYARRFRRKLAEAGSKSGLGRLRANLQSDDQDQDDVYFAEMNKSGDSPVNFDVDAQEATQNAILKFLSDHNSGEQPVWAGEDVKYVAMRRPPLKSIVCRCDSVDGSTLVNNTWMGAASVTVVELYFGSWSRLEALSITSMTGMTMSAENHTRRVTTGPLYSGTSAAPRLRPAEGEVYYADHLTGFRARIIEHRPDRHPGSIAAVAYSKSRAERIRPYVEAAWQVSSASRGKRTNGRYFNAAGNPIIFGLVLGQLEAVIEPEPTALHDSAFLAIHEILGGKVVRLDDLAPLNYIEMYQKHAPDFGGTAKPIPPYIAYVGDELPAWMADVHASNR